MIIIDYPINKVKHYLTLKKLWRKFINGDLLTRKNELDYYEAKANFFIAKWEDSNGFDDKASMKAIKSIEFYDSIDCSNKLLGLI